VIVKPAVAGTAEGPVAPSAPVRLPARLRVARALALALGTLTTLGALVIGATESDALWEWGVGAVILALAVAWFPVALRLAPGRRGPARAAFVLAVLGVAHALLDVVLFGWWSSAVLGLASLAIAALVARDARHGR
jgi:hypothetical protein